MRDLQAAGGAAITAHENARLLRLRLLAVGIAVVGVLADQATKTLALAQLDPSRPIPLLGGLLTLQLIRNPGAAFSMGENFTVVLSLVAVSAAVAVVGWMLPRVRHTGWAVATGCLLAGIIGNLIDRLFREPGPFRGHVIDFLQLPHFAIFNVADMFITAAAVIVLWLTLVTQVSVDGTSVKESQKTPAESGVDE